MRTHDHEPVTIQHDVEAVMVPAGVAVTLRAGKTGFITQALGGSFTVYIEGNLFRIAGRHAAALGKEPSAQIELPPNATDEDVKRLVWEQMSTCYDPEIPVNIVELGLIYECELLPADTGNRIAALQRLADEMSVDDKGRRPQPRPRAASRSNASGGGWRVPTAGRTEDDGNVRGPWG